MKCDDHSHSPLLDLNPMILQRGKRDETTFPKRAPEHCSIRFIREGDSVISKRSVKIGGLCRVVQMFLGLIDVPNDVVDLKKGVDDSTGNGSCEGVITLVVSSLEKNLDIGT